MILYMYITPGQGLTTFGDEIFMSTGTSCHFGHLLQVSKTSLWSLVLYNYFFMILYTYIAPGQRQTAPHGTKFWCQQKCLVTSFICCKFQKNVFVILYNFFHDLIHVYSRWEGADSPREQNFDVKWNALSLYPFVASFKEISLKPDFIQFFSWFNTCTCI